MNELRKQIPQFEFAVTSKCEPLRKGTQKTGVISETWSGGLWENRKAVLIFSAIRRKIDKGSRPLASTFSRAQERMSLQKKLFQILSDAPKCTKTQYSGVILET